MTKIRIECEDDNDDVNQIYADDKLVGTIDHDTAGWSGMEQTREILKKLAAEMGIEFEDNVR